MIARAQRAPQRYFQRPDAPHVQLDAARSSLDGFTGRINLNRNSGLLHVNAALWGVSPGFESDAANPGHFSLGRDTAALLSAPGDDIFLVKMAYWIGR